MTRKRYTVRAQRDGDWWAIEVDGVKNAFSQARRIDQIEEMARDVVCLLLEVEPDTFDLDVDVTVPPYWKQLVGSVSEAKAAAAAAERTASSRIREVAEELKRAGLPVRDIGSLLGVSAQRVSQLTMSKILDVPTIRRVRTPQRPAMPPTPQRSLAADSASARP